MLNVDCVAGYSRREEVPLTNGMKSNVELVFRKDCHVIH